MASNKPSQYALKRRESKENQSFLRYDETPFYSLDKVHTLDWKLFMWFASLEKVENYVNLIIVVWDNIEDIREFNEEIPIVIRYIEALGTKYTNYSKILSDYKACRYDNNKVVRDILVNNSWAELEGCGLRYFSYAVSDQLERCTLLQKEELRNMIISRIEFFKELLKRENEKLRAEKILRTQITDVLKENSQRDNLELLKRENERLRAQVTDLMKGNSQQDNQELLKRENERLRAQVTDLMRENSQQQVALGNLTNVSWNDDDPHNSKKLIKDITDLQDMLNDFTMVQGNDYKVNDNTADALLKACKCEVNYPSQRAKLILGYLLQRIAIDTITAAADNYLNGPLEDQDTALEKNIVNTTESLIKQTLSFKEKRKGEDDITKIIPTKIRQHVYSALSCRGLPIDHPLIQDTANRLLDEMNIYRQVVDEETKDESDDLAIQITHKVINIFCFSLKTQASVPTYQFFDAGKAVDPHLMQGAFDESRKLEVEACGFPCIGIFNDDRLSNRIFMKAQVIPRSKHL